jgi:HEPN domain-containing protein
MSAPPEVVEVLRQWNLKAEHDLEAARRIVAIEDGCPFDTVCFHCRQAAEKYLKCLLTYFGIQAPRTHGLDALAALIPSSCCFPVLIEQLVTLNLYAVNVRYADDWREPDARQAHSAIRLALAVRDAVRAVLPSAALDESALQEDQLPSGLAGQMDR